MSNVRISVDNNADSQKKFALFELGFRPFFLIASLHAVIAILVWSALYNFGISRESVVMLPMLWHAHEMVYGFSLAVIAGFLLTAVRNWTGIETIKGSLLAFLCALWAAARILSFTSSYHLFLVAAACDIVFTVALIYGVTGPVLKAKNRRQNLIIMLLVLLLAGNCAFYYGVLSQQYSIASAGVYLGVYLVIGMILIVGRRVIPFFIERGVDYKTTLVNYTWIDRSAEPLLLLFIISDLFLSNSYITITVASLLFIVLTIRLSGWYTKGIWDKPLLWVLYLGYASVAIGFLLLAVSEAGYLSYYLSLHMFTTGGIGLMTVGMMARVSIGHTGRRIDKPPILVSWIFMSMAFAVIARVLIPVIDMQNYTFWIGVSQIFWIAAFVLFLVTFTSFLISPRPDGKPG